MHIPHTKKNTRIRTQACSHYAGGALVLTYNAEGLTNTKLHFYASPKYEDLYDKGGACPPKPTPPPTQPPTPPPTQPPTPIPTPVEQVRSMYLVVGSGFRCSVSSVSCFWQMVRSTTCHVCM